MGQPRPWRNTSLAQDSQKRWCHIAPTRCMRHSQPRGRPRNSRRLHLLYLVHLHWHKLLLIHRNSLTSCKGGICECDCPRCLSCLSVSKITRKRVHGFGWNVVCRQMSGHGRTSKLLSPIRIIVRIQEPDLHRIFPFERDIWRNYGRISMKFYALKITQKNVHDHLPIIIQTDSRLKQKNRR